MEQPAGSPSVGAVDGESTVGATGAAVASRDGAFRAFLGLTAAVCAVSAYSGYRRDWDLLKALVVIALVAIAALYTSRRLRPGTPARVRERPMRPMRIRVPMRAPARPMAHVDAMRGSEFEVFVAELCRRDGCAAVEVSGGAGDLGADVVALLPDGRKLVIQCKRYGRTRSVGSPDMQRFVGTARPVHGADVAVLVATCRFTAPARDLAADQDIVTVDRKALTRWMAGTELTAMLFPAASRI